MLNKMLVPIIEELINALYESEEDERCLITEQALEELEDLLEEFDSEEEWKQILDFANKYIDDQTNEHDIDLSPLKQIIAEALKW